MELKTKFKNSNTQWNLGDNGTCMELTTSMNSNMEKLKCTKAQIQNRN